MVAIANILHQNVVQLAMLCGMCLIFLYAHVSHIRYFFSSSGMDALTKPSQLSGVEMVGLQVAWPP